MIIKKIVLNNVFKKYISCVEIDYIYRIYFGDILKIDLAMMTGHALVLNLPALFDNRI